MFAQLYSSAYHGGPDVWEVDGLKFYVDVLLLIRFPDVAAYSSGLEEIAATLGSQYCVHNLFAGAAVDPPIESQIIGHIPVGQEDKVTLQGVIVKLHTTPPYSSEGGEWATIKAIAESLSATDAAAAAAGGAPKV